MNIKTKWTKIGNLEWSQDLGEMDWNEANKKCEELGGRLPTRLELLDLLDNHRKDIEDWDRYYTLWSSTECYNFTAYAWYVYLDCGNTNNDTKTTKNNVRCVRM